jgi:hypothetical protein
MKCYVKFYKPGSKKVFTFKVNNESDARKALTRFGVKQGYFLQLNPYKNYKISSR